MQLEFAALFIFIAAQLISLLLSVLLVIILLNLYSFRKYIIEKNYLSNAEHKVLQ